MSTFCSTIKCDPNALYFMENRQVLMEEWPEQNCISREVEKCRLTDQVN